MCASGRDWDAPGKEAVSKQVDGKMDDAPVLAAGVETAQPGQAHSRAGVLGEEHTHRVAMEKRH